MKKTICSLIIIMAFLVIGSPLFAQEKGLFKQVEFGLESSCSFSNHKTPFWMSSNKYGISNSKTEFGYLRGNLKRDCSSLPSLNSKWQLGYGVDIILSSGLASKFFIQQLYGELQYSKWLRLTIGSQEHLMNLKNQELSSGSQTFGINAHPFPEIRLSIPEYLSITGKSNWLAIKGHIAYGKRSDDHWQSEYVASGERYTKGSLIHTKSGFLRIGNEKKFPLVFEGGLEMACEFGGTSYHLKYPGITELTMKKDAKDFINALFGTGSDVTDGNYLNAAGNTVGSILASLSYKFENWKMRTYYDHYFEDHSALFFEYGWLDGLIGAEITLPENPFLTTIIYEHIRTTYQSGPIYHDHTTNVPDQISGVDKYYNHTIFTGWQHWGQSMGNPIYLSPIYNDDYTLFFKSTRFTAHHFGFCGKPLSYLNYRMLFTYSEHLGTYDAPFTDKKYSFSYLGEISYHPQVHCNNFFKNSKMKLAVGYDQGQLIGNNFGIQFTFTKKGFLNF